MTKRKAAEAAPDRILRAVAQLDDVIFTTDRDGTIDYVNGAFERVYGYPAGEAIGQTPRILKGDDLTPEQCAAFWAELVAGRSCRTEFRNRRKDGSCVEVIAIASPILDGDGTISGFIAVQKDVTAENRAAEERRRLDERAAETARMDALGTLAGGLAHDFNNILAIILTHVTLIERRHHDAAVLARSAGIVREAVQRGAALARQILMFGRRATIKAEPVDVIRLIGDLAAMTRDKLPSTIEVTLDFDPDLPLVRADGGQLLQALLNLTTNACDAMPGGGRLAIDARMVRAADLRERFPNARDEDHLVLSVSDTGTGIDEPTRRRMFEPFFTTKEKGKGTGLGLALVFGIVENHKGFIDVESRVGEGTTFRLCLPVEVSAPRAEAKRRDDVGGGSETVLVIEDEPALRDSVSTQLRANGYRVRTAENGVHAIEQCRQPGGLPDAVVMDLGMPRMSATELLRELRELAPHMPVVAMTGYVDPDVHASVIAAGVRSIVAKPFELSELLDAIREVL